MKRDVSRMILAGGLLSLLIVPPASAERRELTATQYTVISNEEQHRVLVAFPSLAELGEEWITGARLAIPLAGGAGSDVDIEVNALTRAWGPGATWTSPWRTPGGDRDESLPASNEVVLRGNAGGELTVDVTDIVREMVSGEMGEHGFLLFPADPGRRGFTGAEMSRIGGLAQVKLTVHYRSLTALGYRGGPEALLERRDSR
jgi:hypothetical protein